MSEECSDIPHILLQAKQLSEIFLVKRGSGAWPGWTAFQYLFSSHPVASLWPCFPLHRAQLNGQMRKSGGARALDWELDLEYNPNVLAGACLFSGPQLLHVKYGGWADGTERQA